MTDRDPGGAPGADLVALSPPRGERWLVAALLLAFVVLNVRLAWVVGETHDEGTHFLYGRSCLAGEPAKTSPLVNNCSPLSAANASASLAGERMAPGPARELLVGLFAARLPTIAAGALLCALAWAWSRALFGGAAGLVTLGLAVLDPNLLAHSHLITTDVYCALGFAAAGWSGWRLARSPGKANAAIHGACLGFALLAKSIALLLVPILLAAALFRRRPAGPVPGPRRPISAAGIVAIAVIVGSVAGAVLHAGYGFSSAFSSLDELEPQSRAFRRLAALPGLGALPIPLPDAWLEGLDLTLRAEREELSHAPAYLMGRLSEQGFPGYYLAAALLKVPIPAWLFVGFALVVAARRRLFDRSAGSIYLWLPAAALALYLNFFYRSQIGIRHALIVAPFFYVLAGAALRDGWPRGRPARLALGGLALWLTVSVAAAFPHYIAYFNELVPDRRFAWRFLADSNLDWGQSRPELAAWLHANPGAASDPPSPLAGRVVVRANALAGLICGDCYAWLWPLTPVGEIGGGSFLIYDVPEEVAAAARARR